MKKCPCIEKHREGQNIKEHELWVQRTCLGVREHEVEEVESVGSLENIELAIPTKRGYRRKYEDLRG